MAVIFEHYHYSIVIVLMMTGLYVVFSSRNLIKKLVGLSVFQTSVFLLYITIGKVAGGQPPILVEDHGGGDYGGDGKDHHAEIASNLFAGGGNDLAVSAAGSTHYSTDILYSNPLPHVLILTAIVVGVATLAIGLALVVRIREVYGSIEEDEINEIDYRFNLEGTAD